VILSKARNYALLEVDVDESLLATLFLSKKTISDLSTLAEGTLDHIEFVRLEHPPSSQNLTTCGFFLLRYLKIAVRCQQFTTTNDRKSSIACFMGGISEEIFSSVFYQWMDPLKQFLATAGNCIE
jgi:hypothetical protein